MGGGCTDHFMIQAGIDEAIKDWIGTDLSATLPSNSDIADLLANYTTEHAHLSRDLDRNQIYLNGFENWSKQVLSGKIAKTITRRSRVNYLAARDLTPTRVSGAHCRNTEISAATRSNRPRRRT